MPKVLASVPWAQAYFKQACFDFLHSKSVLRQEMLPYSRAIALALLQQSAEKALKAGVLRQEARKGNKNEVGLCHDMWTALILKDSAYSVLKDTVIARLVDDQPLKDLEAFAPANEIDRCNTEYPWMEGKEVLVPAEYFHGSKTVNVSSYESVARGVILGVLATDMKLERVWEDVKTLVPDL